MKMSFATKIRLIIAFLLVLAFISAAIVIAQVQSTVSVTESYKTKILNNENTRVTISDLNKINRDFKDIESTIYIFLLLQLILSLVLIMNLPNFLKEALKDINKILKEVKRGNYDINIDVSIYQKRLDKEFSNIIESIKETIDVLGHFDYLKREKIIEQKNRLNAILGIATDGWIVTDMSSNIYYINEQFSSIFPSINADMNLREVNFVPEIEKSIKKYVLLVLRNKSKLDDEKFYIGDLKRHITVKSAMVRNDKGESVGAVFCIPFVEKKKSDKKDKDNGNQNLS